MKKQYNRIDFEKLFLEDIKYDHKIGDQVYLMDEHILNSISDYEFVAPINVFVEVLSGKGHVVVNGIKHKVEGHCLITYLKGQSVQVSVSGKAVVQRGAIVTDEFMEDMYHSAIKFNDIRSSVITNPVVPIGDEQAFGINLYVSALRKIAAKEYHPNNLMCVKLATLALFYGPLYELFKKKIEAETTRSPSLASHFFTLLEMHFRTEYNLGYYADQLKISVTYLYECVVTTTGKAPRYWIDYYRVSFAKKSLADLDLSIQQIAVSLNFAGLPQFSKFFKKQTGLSPMEFRKTLI